MWTLTAEVRSPPVHGHPVLAALMGVGGHTGTEAFTVPASAAPARVGQAVGVKPSDINLEVRGERAGGIS